MPKDVYLGLLEYRVDSAAPTLVASSGKRLDILTDWKESKLTAPQCADEGPLRARDFSRFDLAPYKISATETAFGVRVGWSEGYAGGGGKFEALMQFAQDGERLINIFSEPIYFMQNLAGSWAQGRHARHQRGRGRQNRRLSSRLDERPLRPANQDARRDVEKSVRVGSQQQALHHPLGAGVVAAVMPSTGVKALHYAPF